MKTRRQVDKRPVTSLLVSLSCCLLVWLGVVLSPCHAQPQNPALGPDGVYYTRKTSFSIPFQTESGERRLRQVQLYVSEDQGRTWKQVATAQPEDKSFTYQARGDGHYWFTVRTVDLEGRTYPPSVEQAQPGLKVCVDTQPPSVTLRPLPGLDSSVSVEWELRDENLLDVDSLVLEYRPQGAREWIPVEVQRRAKISHQAWVPSTNALLDVRLRVKDRAGNVGEALTTVSAEKSSDRPQPPSNVNSEINLVNSKRIHLNYELKDVGKSGVAGVELWYTRDGRRWQKYPDVAKSQSPYVFEATEEGLYGFTLLARSGVGLGEQPPREGDLPQIWVEVDLTKPVVRLLNVEVGRGADTGNLTVTWTATDKHLGRQPITLSYAEKTEGPWTPMITNLENSGRYIWRMPEGVPFQFHVRVEATDRAGNVGSAETSKPVAVDLSLPKVRNLKIDAGTK